MNRFAAGFVGICSLIIGIGTLLIPSTYHYLYGVTIDYEDVKWPLFFFTSVFGVICIFVALSKQYWKNPFWICPKCEEVISPIDGEETRYCNKCNVSLKKLEGFYSKKGRQKKKQKEERSTA